MGKIEMKGMRFFAHHGCYEEERIHGRWFEVDLTFDVEANEAMQHDKIEGTINYAEVYNIVKGIMEQPVNLIEHVAYRIQQGITMSFPLAQNLTVSVKKMSPPIDGEMNYVCFTCSPKLIN